MAQLPEQLPLPQRLLPYTKAVSAGIALLIPLLTAIITATADNVISVAETLMIVSAAGAFIGGIGAVFQFRNVPAENNRSR